MKGYSSKLIILFGILLVVGIWIFVWRQLDFEYNMVIDSTFREEQNLAQIYEEHVRGIIQYADSSLVDIRHIYLDQGINNSTLDELAIHINSSLVNAPVGIADAKGNLQPLPITVGNQYNIVDRDYFATLRDATSDVLFIGKPVVGWQSHRITIPICRRVTNPDGSFGGLVIIGVKSDFFTDSIKNIDLGPHKRVVLSRMDGVNVLEGGDETIIGKDIRNGPVYLQATQHPSGTLVGKSVVDGITRIWSYRTLPEYSLFIAIGVSTDDALSSYQNRKYGYLGVSAVVSLFIGWFCLALIRHNVNQEKMEEQIALDATQLNTLQETTSRLVNRYEKIDTLLQAIVQDAVRLVNAPHGCIAMVNPDQETWTINYGVGNDQQRIGNTEPISKGLIGEIICHGQIVYVPNYVVYPNRLQEDILDPLRSILGVPLIIGDEVVGVLTAHWTQVFPQPSSGVLRTLRQYANLASVALERTRSLDQIHELVYTDPLTRLPNRLCIYTRLGEEIDKAHQDGKSGTVLFIDLDNLKLVNDTFGHSYGDNMIVDASKHIQASIGEESFVGRLAGDEFIVLLPHISDRREIEVIADRLLQALDRQYEWQGSSIRTTASIGIATFLEDGATVDDILQNADTALYAAKNQGKQSWRFYDSAQQQEMRAKMLLANSMHYALLRQELFLNYQPIVSCSGSIVGFEALVRWQNPQHGLIPPAVFIPIAEQTRLIQPIGAWVLIEACQFARRLADAGYGHLPVEVNISALQIEDDHFIDIVTAAIDHAGIKPSQLGLEITESVFMDSIADSATKLKHLQDMGVKVSIDDFGEGYSCLTSLLQLPVNTLKISRTLILLLGESIQHNHFVTSIIAMAHALGLKVVAEGVETQEQLSQIIKCNCDWIQGFFFYKPMEGEAALQILANQATEE